MNKDKESMEALIALIACGEGFIEAGRQMIECAENAVGALKLLHSQLSEKGPDEPTQEAKVEAKAKAPELSYEEVRGKVAKMAAKGHKEKIKELVLKYANGGTRLSDVPEDKFDELIKEVEELK